jgi:hypothetical protein
MLLFMDSHLAVAIAVYLTTPKVAADLLKQDTCKFLVFPDGQVSLVVEQIQDAGIWEEWEWFVFVISNYK